MKLLVTDYDNTIYYLDNEEKTLNNVNKLKEFHDNGNIICIATGRSKPSILLQVSKYNIPVDYYICADGSMIYDNKFNIIKKNPMDTSVVNEINEFIKGLIYEEIQYSYKDGYTNKLNLQEEIMGINIVIHKNNVTDKLLEKFKYIENTYPDYSYLVYIHDPIYYLCVKNKGISKSSGISYLSNYLNIDDIYVIGDSSNDLDMIKDFNGACVSNSTPDVKEITNNIYDTLKDYIDKIKD